MNEILDAMDKAIPLLAKYENWVKWIVASWILLTSITVIAVLFGPQTSLAHSQPDTSSPGASETLEYVYQWKLTGDSRIDRALQQLNILERQTKGRISDIDLVRILNPLFSRPAFYGIREENWEYFLYPLCKSRLILEHYQNNFSNPDHRTAISNAVIKMVTLQNKVAVLYGPTFKIDKHIQQHIDHADQFIGQLPNRIQNPTSDFFYARDQEISQIRNILKPIGLVN